MRNSTNRALRPIGLRRAALMAVASLILLAACVAGASAAGNVKAARAYVGTIGTSRSNSFGGTSVSFDVSANGRTAAATAVYSNCAVGGIGSDQVSFPVAKVVHGSFKTTHARPGLRAGLYATITIKGHFLAGGRASGTISGTTNQNLISGGRGSICGTSNPWSAKAKPKGFAVCEPRSVPPAAIAQDITSEHTSCPVVEKAIHAGRYEPPLTTGRATFSTPGWACRSVGSGSGAFTCKRSRSSFHFVVV